MQINMHIGSLRWKHRTNKVEKLSKLTNNSGNNQYDWYDKEENLQKSKMKKYINAFILSE